MSPLVIHSAIGSPIHDRLQQPQTDLQQHLRQCHEAGGVMPRLRGWIEVADVFMTSRQASTLALLALLAWALMSLA